MRERKKIRQKMSTDFWKMEAGGRIIRAEKSEYHVPAEGANENRANSSWNSGKTQELQH